MAVDYAVQGGVTAQRLVIGTSLQHEDILSPAGEFARYCRTARPATDHHRLGGEMLDSGCNNSSRSGQVRIPGRSAT
jgi:hypothetical protein